MPALNNEIKGLTDAEVVASRAKFGVNVQVTKSKTGLLASLIEIVKEPMFLLLVAASTIYFITGNNSDGIFMLSAIVIVSAISLLSAGISW